VPAYPGEPWALRGQLHTSLFLVPVTEVPADVPGGFRPVRLGRFGLVGTAWVSYEPGGVLAYRELMSTLLVRRGIRLMPTITHIWVDSEASRDGGRALWGIPKQLAEFSFTGSQFSADDDGGPVAAGTVRPRWRLPGRWPVGFRVAQWLGGKAKVTPVRASAQLGLAKAAFDADGDGPLAFLAGRRPLVSFSLRDFTMVFGNR
jgi:hypothetical protein